MSTPQKPDETFTEYKLRCAYENKLERLRLHGKFSFVSSAIFPDEKNKGKFVKKTCTYMKSDYDKSRG